MGSPLRIRSSASSSPPASSASCKSKSGFVPLRTRANTPSVVGLLHHLQFRRTQRPTKLAPYHVWTGRVVIPLGIANAFVYVLSTHLSPSPPPLYNPTNTPKRLHFRPKQLAQPNHRNPRPCRRRRLRRPRPQPPPSEPPRKEQPHLLPDVRLLFRPQGTERALRR